MYPEVLDGPRKSLLALLERSRIPPRFYLARGTALALHPGHRRSGDLDFFSMEVFTSDQLLEDLRRLGEFQVRRNGAGTLILRVEGVELSFIRYQYPMLDSPAKPDFGPPVAGIRDIASMKLTAIMGRGSRRDCVDLFAVCQHGHSLQEVHGWFQEKYRGISYDPSHLAKSLVYFLDAEEERMPAMLQPCSWDEVKAFFLGESQRIFKG